MLDRIERRKQGQWQMRMSLWHWPRPVQPGHQPQRCFPLASFHEAHWADGRSPWQGRAEVPGCANPQLEKTNMLCWTDPRSGTCRPNWMSHELRQRHLARTMREQHVLQWVRQRYSCHFPWERSQVMARRSLPRRLLVVQMEGKAAPHSVPTAAGSALPSAE